MSVVCKVKIPIAKRSCESFSPVRMGISVIFRVDISRRGQEQQKVVAFKRRQSTFFHFTRVATLVRNVLSLQNNSKRY